MAVFPDGKRFAFSVFDDTDFGTVENLSPVYRLLDELGLRTTKSVWPLAGPGVIGGQTLQDRDYRDFVLDLRARGFEIGLHGVQDGSAARARVEAGLREFTSALDADPRVNTNHSRNRDNLYWGARRINSRVLRAGYQASTLLRQRRPFLGHDRRSQHFWGDLCGTRIAYMRNLVFSEINLDRINPSLPYFDPHKPLVPHWFSSSDGADVERCCALLSEANQERLEAQGGVCIMYTHFACGFVEDGRVNPRFAELLARLARRGGWFVPVGPLLDHLRAQRGGTIPPRELARMERLWVAERLARTAPALRDNLSREQRPAHQTA